MIETTSTITVLEMWEGTGWIQYHGTSSIDPWLKLEVKEMMNASFTVYDQVLPQGKVIKSYSPDQL